jgi:hypothetical protein
MPSKPKLPPPSPVRPSHQKQDKTLERLDLITNRPPEISRQVETIQKLDQRAHLTTMPFSRQVDRQ